MIAIALSIATFFVLLLIVEILWRKKTLSAELSRKIIHIIVGSIIAFWPFFIEWRVIQLLSIILFVGITLSYKLHLFKSIHSVKRSTKGELLYPISIGICALMQPAPWIFTAAILHLSFADGLAAIVGSKTNGWTQYKIFGHKKSLVGSGVFFIVSLSIICASYAVLATDNIAGVSSVMLLLAAVGISVVENISWYGLDNLTVPISVIIFLSVL